MSTLQVFVNDQFLNWDPEHLINVRIVSARAYHSWSICATYISNWVGGRCIRPTLEELESFGVPDFAIYNAGQFPSNRYTHHMTLSTSIDLNLARREMMILGRKYAEEMKKGRFSIIHYLMPKRRILSLHSVAAIWERTEMWPCFSDYQALGRQRYPRIML